jgi:succinate dehydrogenase / fumarate reductase, cytochrome b subunit
MVPATMTFFRSTIGRKAVMSITGIILFGFLIGHMAGNLQLFLGEHKFDGYAAFLKATPLLLWGTRAVLLVSLLLHVWAAVTLTAQNRAARAVAYSKYRPIVSTPASRTMMVSGIILLVFIVYHLLHFTVGTIHPRFEHVRAYQNVVIAFRGIFTTLIYLASMGVLAFHLWHGIWSLFQSLGLNHPKWNRYRNVAAIALTILICGGFALVPLGVILGAASQPATAEVYIPPVGTH